MRNSMTIHRTLTAHIAVCLLAIALAGCGALQGDAVVDTADGEGAIGKGPGLFTGKRGAIVIDNDVWSGAVQEDDGTAAE